LLERGVKVMSYVGEYDWICEFSALLVQLCTISILSPTSPGVAGNYHGNEAWVHNLAWTGQDSFVATPLREWSVDGHVAGTVKTSGGLTFATIHQAGYVYSSA
jgi:carboxypeptidase C (cathepsin A)